MKGSVDYSNVIVDLLVPNEPLKPECPTHFFHSTTGNDLVTNSQVDENSLFPGLPRLFATASDVGSRDKKPVEETRWVHCM